MLFDLENIEVLFFVKLYSFKFLDKNYGMRKYYAKGTMVKKVVKQLPKNSKKSKFGMLSVKAGIDKNPNPTQADRIAGAKMKNKGKKA